MVVTVCVVACTLHCQFTWLAKLALLFIGVMLAKHLYLNERLKKLVFSKKKSLHVGSWVLSVLLVEMQMDTTILERNLGIITNWCLKSALFAALY